MAYWRPLSWSSGAHPSFPVGQITCQPATLALDSSKHPSSAMFMFFRERQLDSVMARLLWVAQFEFVRIQPPAVLVADGG